MNAKAGEIWWADVSIVEKNSRPVLVLSPYSESNARAQIIVVPLTTQIRGGRGEVSLGNVRGLTMVSAVNLQGIGNMERRSLVRKAGSLSTHQMEAVKSALRELLDL